jgi:5S rRNA maturation endonuclease (ribonuclease M5)
VPTIHRVIVCEGPDDLSALRDMVRRKGASAEGPGSKHERRLVFRKGKIRLVIAMSRGGKSGLAQRTIDLTERTAEDRPDIVGVCFDPDDDGEASELGFFQAPFLEFVSKKQWSAQAESCEGSACQVVR